MTLSVNLNRKVLSHHNSKASNSSKHLSTKYDCVSKLFKENLKNNLLGGLICFQEVANIDKSPLFTGIIFTLEMIPAKFYELFTVMNEIIL